VEDVTLAGKTVRVVGDDGALLGGVAISLMVFREPALVIAVLSNTSYADTSAIALTTAEAFRASVGSH
jgi:hypothetical protein